MLSSLLRYRKNIYSQNGEDGILIEILARLDIGTGWFCEFGAWDGMHLSNTYQLLENGWQGVMIEGDTDRFTELKRLADRSGDRLHPINAYISEGGDKYSLDSLLGQSPIPTDFDILSIDVDSIDYYIWESLTRYQPKIVVIEINGHLPPGEMHTHNDRIPGSSFSSTINLGLKKGYVPCVHTGNIIFVREDLVEKVAQGDTEITKYESQFLFTTISAKGSFINMCKYYWQRIHWKLLRL